MGENVAEQQKGCVTDRVVAAARRLFAARGFHQTAMADLAAEAQVSVGTIYRVFAGKADIIRAIIVADSERIFAELNHDIDRALSGEAPVEAVIEQIVERHLAEQADALVHEALAEAHRDEKVAALIGHFFARYREIVRRLVGLANPRLSERELDAAEELMIACLFGLGHRTLIRPRLDPDEAARIITGMILSALGHAAADSPPTAMAERL
ncbi:TetR/AcrR family transcriptional regulator [Novosphingobium album (ex Liu et al. 2023)]|uniref:TetR/AcrR family transcriptional regulator n=1 Tax=Novosphingobium album (ex Liu et al. 2023) TaxID=3031130 RepID=A0ABT5WSV4_9SPHN|nr:TetR/AcrR family transcriptional regulator [Novosphingobium album (ex Liu et al. 2023)]MDE8653122.1 TetR/AcrR family transcriptional regulator [Novosphingobium album (ex Liu et al. 2023)]